MLSNIIFSKFHSFYNHYIHLFYSYMQCLCLFFFFFFFSMRFIWYIGKNLLVLSNSLSLFISFVQSMHERIGERGFFFFLFNLFILNFLVYHLNVFVCVVCFPMFFLLVFCSLCVFVCFFLFIFIFCYFQVSHS